MTALPPVAEIQMLGDFQIWRAGTGIGLHRAEQRMIGYLALRTRAVERATVAAALWPALTPNKGLSRVRDVLYKIKNVAPELISAAAPRVGLADSAIVDVAQAQQYASDLLRPHAPSNTAAPLTLFTADAFCSELLPSWDEDWLVADQRAFSLLRLRALERLAQHRLTERRFAEAEHACCAVIEAEPHRETAHLLLARVYLNEGNTSQALRTLSDLQRRLRVDLGLGASEQMRQLAATIRAVGRRPVAAVS